MNQPLGLLAVTTAATAALHTLIPDHWLPFVLVARSEGWDARRTALLTGASALVHVTVSLSLAMAAQFLARGAEAAVGVGESFGRLAAVFLTGFGLLYGTWFLVRGGHQHSLGLHPHHIPGPGHREGSSHPHDLPAGGNPPWAGPARRASSSLRRSKALALVAIMGFNPCVLVIPYIYLAGSMGAWALTLVGGAFALSTVGCMVGVALLGLHGTARLESPFLIRYGEALSGGLIAATGLVIYFAGP
ncbi:MAG TPA: hypothetical protein VNI57_08200 [Candidatus Saccharimonadales bacterium]|nr:hypothetical protein [Candidatus Saccharimonadales bacterium]